MLLPIYVATSACCHQCLLHQSMLLVPVRVESYRSMHMRRIFGVARCARQGRQQLRSLIGPIDPAHRHFRGLCYPLACLDRKVRTCLAPGGSRLFGLGIPPAQAHALLLPCLGCMIMTNAPTHTTAGLATCAMWLEHPQVHGKYDQRAGRVRHFRGSAPKRVRGSLFWHPFPPAKKRVRGSST
jgi:hypothetical protein